MCACVVLVYVCIPTTPLRSPWLDRGRLEYTLHHGVVCCVCYRAVKLDDDDHSYNQPQIMGLGPFPVRRIPGVLLEECLEASWHLKLLGPVLAERKCDV